MNRNSGQQVWDHDLLPRLEELLRTGRWEYVAGNQVDAYGAFQGGAEMYLPDGSRLFLGHYTYHWDYYTYHRLVVTVTKANTDPLAFGLNSDEFRGTINGYNIRWDQALFDRVIALVRKLGAPVKSAEQSAEEARQREVEGKETEALNRRVLAAFG